jgi:hypothetical protein
MSGLTWGSGGWESPWLLDPNNSNTLFCGLGKNFYKSINAGTSWTLISTEPSINYFQDIKIANSLLLRFTNVNAYGDIIYVDNINLNNSIISGFTKREEDDMFSLFPNPTNGILNIKVKNSNQKCMIYNSEGAIIMMKNEVPEKINLEHLVILLILNVHTVI